MITHSLVAWQEYRVDADGDLIVENQLSRDPDPEWVGDSYYVVGEVSGALGEGKGSEPHILLRTTEGAATNCPGASPSRIVPGRRASVCTKSDRVAVRDEPHAGGAELFRLDPGSILLVVGGPICADSSYWWEISLEGWESEGWISEGGDAVDPYYICTVE